MLDKKEHTKKEVVTQKLVEVIVDENSPVHIVGDPAILWKGGPSGYFTPQEAEGLLKLSDRHGTTVCRIVTKRK